MRLLVDFLCRFGWGMAAALAATPASMVPAGFYRVNLLVVLGLTSVAAFLARIEVPGVVWGLAGAAAVTAWVGSVAWFGERVRVGLTCCVLCAALWETERVTDRTITRASLVLMCRWRFSPPMGRPRRRGCSMPTT